jgi:VanZ family protein
MALARQIERMLFAWWSSPRWGRLAVPVLLATLLWWSSSTPRTTGPSDMWRSLAHNGAHVVAYALLGAAVWLVRARHDRSRRTSIVGLVATVGYGLLDELHQSFVPGRVASLVDVASDASGAWLATQTLDAILVGRSWGMSIFLLSVIMSGFFVLLATFGPW